MDIGFEQKVRERAYELWVESGMAEGLSLEHWCAAETSLNITPPAPKKPLAKATASKAPPAKVKAAPVKTKAVRAKPPAKKAGLVESAIN